MSFQLIPAVLEPYFHLGLRELQRGGEARALRAAQVALHVEGRLQLEDLSLGENSARLLFRDHFALLARAAAAAAPLVGVCGGGGGVNGGVGGAAVVAAAAVAALEAHLRLVSAAEGDRVRRRVAVRD